MYRNKGCLIWWERTTKMATAEKLSMAGELLCDLRAKSYDTCLSNLTKTHCVNLKKFNRERLPEGAWIMCKRFLTNSNRIVPNALFDLFGEFSDQTGSIVCDNMVGWAFDNYRLLENVCKIAMDQRKTTLRGWINEMANEQTPGDEIALYILSRMYHKHAFVYTQMFWWMTLLYTWPVQEKEIMDKCEVVLVYMKPGAFGELQKIRPLTATSTRVETSLPADLPLVVPQDAEETTQQTPITLASTPVITGGASGNNLVPTGSTPNSTTTDNTPPALQGCVNAPDTAATTSAPLPKIDIFMTQHCSIPLIRCNFDSALKAANSHNKEMHKTTGNAVPDNKPPDEVQPDKTQEVQTSSCPRTVTNYKQFLEEYADAPPTPPRKKHEVDLKCKPSKQRIAADKFRSKFVTKPMHLPRPVRNKTSKKDLEAQSKPTVDPQPSTSDTPAPKSNTVLTPAMSTKTKEAIEALLMLGDMPTMENNPVPNDDNAFLVPITGVTPDKAREASQADDAPESLPTNQTPDQLTNTPGNPPPGIVIGTAIKTDGDNDNDTQRRTSTSNSTE